MRFPKLLCTLAVPFAPLALRAQDTAVRSAWHADTVPQALLNTAIFSCFGILLAIGGYKLFDLCTPGKLHDEIVHHKNIAAAIVGGSVILGVAIIVAASMIG